jgi:hypothetical protein
MWNEAAIAYVTIYLSICLEGLRESTKTSVRIAGHREEI